MKISARGAAALFLAAALLGCGAPSDSQQAAPAEDTASGGQILISEAWAAPTPGGVDVAAGYLTITNLGEADRLVSASSPRAAQVALHQMSAHDGVMSMSAMDALEAPSGGTVSLAPGGNHLMFTGVTAPFTVGEEIPVTLTFEHAGAMEVSLPVRAPDTGGGAH